MEFQEDDEYTSVIDNLVSMFGHTLTKEVISTVVESYEGDLSLAVDALMKLTNDGNIMSAKEDEGVSNEANATSPDEVVSDNANPTSPVPPPSQLQSGSSPSYAVSCVQNRGAVPKQTPKTRPPALVMWTDQIRQIITNHNKGACIMIFMRGLPGSGKSYLATALVESLVSFNPKSHIFSTDDYFMVRGQYRFDQHKLPYAHSWNQDRVKLACAQGFSPIIVDNTNIELWEMQPYLMDGVRNGYIIEVIEMNTPWAKKANQLFRRNKHGVPFASIKRKLENYTEGITGQSLIQAYGLSYPSDMVPPVNRLLPPMYEEKLCTQEQVRKSASPDRTDINASSAQILSPANQVNEEIQTQQMTTVNETNQLLEEENLLKKPEKPSTFTEQNSQIATNITSEIDVIDDLTQEEEAKQKIVQEVQKRLEEIEKFEQEWENGEKWDDNDQPSSKLLLEADRQLPNTSNSKPVTSSTGSKGNVKTSTSLLITNLESKPPRKEKTGVELDSQSKCLTQPVNEHRDWRSIFMPPWVGPEEQPLVSNENIPIETQSSSTCVEFGDTNVSGKHKVLVATPRDINEFYIAPEREKIPEKRMLHKSSMTNEGILMSFHCPQKEKHFIVFRKLFKHIERESLRDIFDNCCGDANWAVESILGGGVKYTLKSFENEEESDMEEEFDPNEELTCSCLAHYNIIPDMYKSDSQLILPEKEKTQDASTYSVPYPEKKKRDVVLSEENIKIKRQIEQNIVISDSHYSDHTLKIRKLRRGDYNTDINISEQPSTSGTVKTSSTQDSNKIDESDDDDDDSISYVSDGDNDKIINVDVGSPFIKQLDNMFDRKDMEYPDNIEFKISIPTSLLNQLNALWMESIMYQLDEFAKKSAEMIKQDEEFARQIALKETELMLAGKAPEVLDLKEIMDLEIATSIYLKDTSQWRNKIPTDLAAKMSQEKLYNLFPEIEKDVLLEMLMAHDNNFKATVEVLLISMGRSDLLETKEGLNKFVMDKELECHEKILEEQRQAIAKLEWPPEHNEEINMDTIQGYREEATQHSNFRNVNKQKAEEFIRRGMPQVATYYTDIANYHKTKQDQADSLAVASLIQYHAKNNTDSDTVDLHYFRVKEAKEAMDVFIDTHIHKIREMNKRHVVLYFITGRGLHSSGRPRVKPACIKRLRERGLRYSECNPGLIRTRVSCNAKLTFQVT